MTEQEALENLVLSLEAEVKREKVLRLEMNHRVNNMLAIVSSVLQMQARDTSDTAISDPLDDAANRIATVARAHDILFHAGDIGRIDIGKYIEDLYRDFASSSRPCVVQVAAKSGIMVPTDHAIAAAFIVRELTASAMTWAYSGGGEGKIDVTVLDVDSGFFSVAVSDDGAKLPEDFEAAEPTPIHLRLATLFAQQIGGTLERQSPASGNSFLLTAPRKFTA